MSKESTREPGKIRRTFAGALLLIKLMGVHDEYRIEMALNKLKRSKFGIYLTNFLVFPVLAYVKISSLLKEKRKNLFANKAQDFSHLWDKGLPPRAIQRKPRILILGEMLNKQCRLYRVDQKRQQFERLGWHCEVFSWQQLVEAEERLPYIDIVIIYRVIGTPKVLALIDYIRSLNKITIFDVDDLVFDKELLEKKYLSESELLAEDVKQGNLRAANLYKTTAQHCDYAITTTQTLQVLLSELTIQKQCFILPNALSEEAYLVAGLPMASRSEDKVTILYGSGSQTHDDDFQEVANALLALMQRHNHLQIAVLGKLNLPNMFSQFGERIIQLPILDFSSYLMFVRQSDINIAPLQTDIFTDAKSEIKWLEAALFEVPTVMTPTKTYREVVEEGRTGFFAETQEQWFDRLNSLIESKALRLEVGNNAMQSALNIYGREAMSSMLAKVILDIQSHALSVGILHKNSNATKKSILVVDSYYSPGNAHYDPMNSVRRQVEQLDSEHVDEYEILVVTADSEGVDKYVVTDHALNGVSVKTIGVGVEFERLNDYQNPRIEDNFEGILESFSPDIIHFHNLELMSCSVIDIARKYMIPYAVTIYDTDWWLTSGKHRADNEQVLTHSLPEVDPFSMIGLKDNVSEKMIRSSYLIDHLGNADKVFLVSTHQYKLFEKNGINSVLLPEGVAELYAESNNEAVASIVSENKTVKKVAVIGTQLNSDDTILEILKACSDEVKPFKIELHQIDFSQLPDFNDQKVVQGFDVITRGSWMNHKDASEFISNMDVLFLSSEWTSQSDLIIQEALSKGTLVVIPELDSYALSIEPGSNGYFYTFDNVDSLNTALRESLSRERITSNTGFFTLSESVQELANHYQDIHSSNDVESL